MDRKEFLQLVKSGKVRGAYLFEGVEENIKAAVLQSLRKAILPEGMEELNETLMDAPAADAIIAACETLPFLADQRLVVVREHPALTGRSDADERLLSYIPNVPESCVLVFIARGKADARKKLYTAIKKTGGIVTFAPLNDAELNSWIIKTFTSLGKSITPQTASLLPSPSARTPRCCTGRSRSLQPWPATGARLPTRTSRLLPPVRWNAPSLRWWMPSWQASRARPSGCCGIC